MTVLDPPKFKISLGVNPQIPINTIKSDGKLIFGIQIFMQYTKFYFFSRHYKSFNLIWDGSVILPFEKLATLCF